MSFPYPALSSNFSSKSLNPILASYLNIIFHLASYPPYRTILRNARARKLLLPENHHQPLPLPLKPRPKRSFVSSLYSKSNPPPPSTSPTSSAKTSPANHLPHQAYILHEAPRTGSLLPPHTHFSCLHNCINTDLSEDDFEWFSCPKCRTGV
jgi:hypothetical protein